MSELIRVPDIGSGEGEVIELFVKVGDRIEADQSILTLESDKASMEIPAPKAGIVKSLKVKLGDRLKEGDELLSNFGRAIRGNDCIASGTRRSPKIIARSTAPPTLTTSGPFTSTRSLSPSRSNSQGGITPLAKRPRRH